MPFCCTTVAVSIHVLDTVYSTHTRHARAHLGNAMIGNVSFL